MPAVLYLMGLFVFGGNVCSGDGYDFTGEYKTIKFGLKSHSAVDRLGLIFCYTLITIVALCLFLNDIGQSVGDGVVTGYRGFLHSFKKKLWSR